MFSLWIFKILYVINEITLSITLLLAVEFCFAKSALNSKVPLQGPPHGFWFKGSPLGYLVIGSSLFSKKKKFSQNNHSLTFFVIVVNHLMSLVLPLVVTRCITCLSCRFINDRLLKRKLKVLESYSNNLNSATFQTENTSIFRIRIVSRTWN